MAILKRLLPPLKRRLNKYVKDGRIFYNANRGLKQHHMMIEHGELSTENPVKPVDSGLVFIDKQHQIEKNWVLFEDEIGRAHV